MKNTITVEVHNTFEIDKEDFVEYLLDNYCAYEKEYRPKLTDVLNNYVDKKLEECLGVFVSWENLSNTFEVLETLENWANEYFEKISFNEEK